MLKKITIVMLLAFLQLNAEDVNEQKYKFAKSFEETGDYGTSSRIYKELFDLKPENTEYFQGIVRTYKGLFQYSELKPIIKKHIQYKKSVENYSLFAETLWRTGSIDSANFFWDRALELLPEKPHTYKTISESQVELRQYDKAINILLKGRGNIETPHLFADELCQLYIVTGNHLKGAKEAVNLLNKSKNIALTQGRLAALMSNKESTTEIEEVLKEAVDESNENYLILKVYAWFLRATDRLEEAFDIYKKMDLKINSKGREVLTFANDSKNDAQWDIALKAYEYIISMGKETKYLSSALYGYPRTLEQKMLNQKTLTKENALSIIERYKKITEDFPNNIASADASFRIATLYLEQLNDKTLAKEELNKIIKQFPNTRHASQALNVLGSIQIMEDDFQEAEKTFKLVSSKYARFSKEETAKALYNLAEMQFFQSNIDSSQVLYANLIKNSGSDVTNDALERIFLIEQSKNYPNDIAKYAKSQLILKQRKTKKGINILKELSSSSYSEYLAQRALFELSKIEFESKKYQNSLNYSLDLLDRYKESIYSDRIMIIAANNYQKLGKKEQAINILTQLITNYPRSIYAQEARDTIRLLRDNLKF